MSDLSVGQQYVHREEGYQVTVTALRKKILGTETHPVVKILVAYTRVDDDTKMMTEQTLFNTRFAEV